MLNNAWFASKLVEEKPIFLNLNELCFSLALLKKNCSCSNVAFIKYSWCQENVCFTCFYDKYHPHGSKGNDTENL